NDAFRCILDNCPIEANRVPKSILTFFLCSDVAGQCQYALRFAGSIANGAYDHIPPPWFMPDSGRKEPGKASNFAAAGLLNSCTRGLTVRTLPELNPRLTQNRSKVTDFELLHSSFVHEY